VRGFRRVEAARGDAALTYFEFGTLAAWEVFAAAEVDAIILEVGLGGRLDATNAYQHRIAPSSPVSTSITWTSLARPRVHRPRKGRHFPLRNSGDLR
jgi:dihydrofolate synthase/folylpolyglutamate synthase